MKFVTHNDKDIEISGTSWKGNLTISYSKLCEVLGEPMLWVHDKSQAEWVIEFEDGMIATIYDWKYQGRLENNQFWKIGGFENRVISRINNLLWV